MFCALNRFFTDLALQRYVFFLKFPSIWQRCDKKNTKKSHFCRNVAIKNKGFDYENDTDAFI